jgi:hypothetical protein
MTGQREAADAAGAGSSSAWDSAETLAGASVLCIPVSVTAPGALQFDLPAGASARHGAIFANPFRTA